MELNVSERLTLLDILPREGRWDTVKVIHELRQSLGFSEEEHKVLKFRQGGEKLDDGTVVPEGRIQWKDSADTPKDIEIGPIAMSIIVKVLRDLDKREKLTEAHLTLCEKFLK